MSPRLNPVAVAPNAYKAILALEKYVRGSVEPHLLHLVKLRASQINGCAFCIDIPRRSPCLRKPACPTTPSRRWAGIFSETEIVNLTVAISTINVWNRFAVSFRTPHPVGMERRVGG